MQIIKDLVDLMIFHFPAYGRKMMPYFYKKGFTLIELILVLAIMIILMVFLFMNVFDFFAESSLTETAKSLVFALRSTRDKAMAQEGGTSWGIRFDNPSDGTDDTYAIFSGSSYSASNVISRETLPSNVEFTTPSSGSVLDVIFQQITGSTTPVNISLRSRTKPSLTSTISVSLLGEVSY